MYFTNIGINNEWAGGARRTTAILGVGDLARSPRPPPAPDRRVQRVIRISASVELRLEVGIDPRGYHLARLELDLGLLLQRGKEGHDDRP